MLTYSKNPATSKIIYLIATIVLICGMFLPCTYVHAQDNSSAKEPWQGAYTTTPFAGGAIRNVYCDLAQEVEGSFGALVFIVGGFVAFSLAVFGNGKRAYSTIAAGIAGAVISGGVSLSFGRMCNFNDSSDTARAVAKTIEFTDTDQAIEENDSSLF